MAEGAFNQSLVLHVDDDGEREVIGFAPGPAGVAEIELSPGTHLSVDYAEPTTLCSIRTTRAADPRVIADGGVEGFAQAGGAAGLPDLVTLRAIVEEASELGTRDATGPQRPIEVDL